MPQNTHLDIISADAERLMEPVSEAHSPQAVHRAAEELARSLKWLPNSPSSHTLAERVRTVARAYRPIFAALELPPLTPLSDDLRWLYDNERLLYGELHNAATIKKLVKTPHVRNQKGAVVPRVLAMAEGLLEAVSWQFNEQEFGLFVEVFQRTTVLQLHELRALPQVLRLALLEKIARRSEGFLRNPAQGGAGIGVCVRSLRDIGHTVWKDALEPLIVIDQVLRQDPAGAYAQMDFDSRDLYRNRIAEIAQNSDFSETEVANAALVLAQEGSRRTYDDPRIALRERHVGYYIVDKGAVWLGRRTAFRPPLVEKIQGLLRQHPNDVFLPGIVVLTLAISVAATLLLTDPSSSLLFIAFSMVVLLLPSSQSAVQVMNFLVTSLLPPEVLPKLDFTEAIPDDCVTLVAVPSLLLSEKQVQGLVEDLEVRFLGNHDSNIHFALVTDLPDSREPAREDSALLTRCCDLIHALNEKYASQGMGSFFLLHRHRVYNPREKCWMGWERKRGKLLDLNKLLRGQYDSFPVKVGDVSILPRVRFVITLDSDTELPRGTARRMIGTLAHPLNQAVIDGETNTVVAGYGILQPRVGVSVQSTAHSRLAAIYAGETGFDIYTRAISDVYQDLYAEGSFTGKGIYEVDAMHRVLDRRFPRNSLLSHDLIEGAYARAGFASDIEVIEDYPSHYSAYNRRKHRWLRGDWQIAGWLFSHVPEESGDRAANPISMISWWKIFDNLRRSLVEPAIFLLFLFGWLVAVRDPWQWTLVTLCIVFIPACFQLVVNLVRAACRLEVAEAQETLGAFNTANINLVFTLTFLLHQTLLALDAVARALVRRLVTKQRLLEWETAAEAELGMKGPAPVDVYLNWMPVFSICLGILIWAARPHALPAAVPLLCLWACSKQVSVWLNRTPVRERNQLSRKDLTFLRNCALHSWKYFAEFSTAEHNWLIPDNIQEQPAAIAARVSPTNIGLLLNAKQVACEFGYLTVPEFVKQVRRTLGTVSSLKKHRGHVLNWYDTRTLEALAPFFVSSVDSGNLLASLWTLQQGCLDCLQRPVLQPSLAEGWLDYVRALTTVHAFPRKVLSRCEGQTRTRGWLQSILEFPDEIFQKANRTVAKLKSDAGSQWLLREAVARVQSTRMLVSECAPWFSPEFSSVSKDLGLNLKTMENTPLEQLPGLIDQIAVRIDDNLSAASTASASPTSGGRPDLYERFREELLKARTNVTYLIADLRSISSESGKLAEEMDFKFLFNSRRKLVSVGFDVDTHSLHQACYDLLATESRTAIFTAIAKEDIPQESWFLLGRAHTLDKGRSALLSWTGTLFEYLMPSLWMRSFPNTLLERSRVAAVRSQQAYGVRKQVPWGFSESAYYKLDEAGNYQYYAFGLPHLALRKPEINRLVVSPYSTFLALDVDPAGALRNLRRMLGMGWFGDYGFYEAADFSCDRNRFWQSRFQVVRCWMVHHQGMSLLALANFLNNNIVQKWFHAERRVLATELLLHEKPVAHVRRKDIPRGIAVA
jgi:cyclic beta-1,2-glucan synthetase